MKAKLTIAKEGIVAWMGGSRPKPITECSADEVALVSLLFREQFQTWHDYWKDYPSRDVARIFWNRARHDAHATFRRTEMKTIILHEAYIGTQFPCALEYGDNTGLDDDEERQLDYWVLDLIREAEESYDIFDPVIYFEYGGESEFETCDITGFKGNCVAVTAFTLV